MTTDSELSSYLVQYKMLSTVVASEIEYTGIMLRHPAAASMKVKISAQAAETFKTHSEINRFIPLSLK